MCDLLIVKRDKYSSININSTHIMHKDKMLLIGPVPGLFMRSLDHVLSYCCTRYTYTLVLLR